MELLKMSCRCWFRNRRRKQSNCRPWYRQWIQSDRCRKESTASMNSRPTHQIDSTNRVKADAWNCQKRYVTADLEIAGENRVTLDLEIVNEYWVIADVCNRQRPWIHNRRIKSIAKIESRVTQGIVKNGMSQQIHKSSAKTKSLLNLKSSLKTEWQLTYGIDSIIQLTNDASNW